VLLDNPSWHLWEDRNGEKPLALVDLVPGSACSGGGLTPELASEPPPLPLPSGFSFPSTLP